MAKMDTVLTMLENSPTPILSTPPSVQSKPEKPKKEPKPLSNSESGGESGGSSDESDDKKR